MCVVEEVKMIVNKKFVILIFISITLANYT